MPLEMEYPACFGPYLRYAIATDFAYFDTLLDFSETHRLSLLAHGKDGVDVTALEEEFERRIAVRAIRPGSRFVLLNMTRDLFDAYKKRLCVFFDHVELSLPVQPMSEPPDISLARLDRPTSRDAVLLGVIDDGCPFANACFLHRDGQSGTRVLALWDQNEPDPALGPIVDPVSGDPFGRRPPVLGYGLEFWRETVPASPGRRRLLGINDWIGLHLSSAGIEEAGCYADARQRSLAGAISHGAHVMDVMAGNMPPASRMGPFGAGRDRRDPPSWAQGGGARDPAGDNDIVFVQIPKAAVDDATGNWLAAQALDGLAYVLSCATPGITQRVVVNISYGPATGPHDGSSLLELALADMVAYYNGTRGRPRLHIVLASGNSFDSAGHVAFDAAPGLEKSWTWRLPPDNTVPCFAEVWMDQADAAGASVALESPYAGAAAQPFRVALGNNVVWLLAVAPTHERSPVRAVHGDWTIRVLLAANAPARSRVHAWAARTDPNMGARTGARSSRFVDAQWERRDAASASQQWRDGEFSLAGSLIDRDCTLNGMATGNVPRLHVAGGYRVIDGRKSSYASSGPARRFTLAGGGRRGPDFALPGDESFVLGGILAAGNRSGGFFRMVGTSTAAPQLARWLADGFDPVAPNPPPTNPGGNPQPERRGKGNLPPPVPM